MLDELVSRLIRKGQPIVHILAEHGEEISCGERTLYTYISRGYLSAKSLGLRRADDTVAERIRRSPAR